MRNCERCGRKSGFLWENQKFKEGICHFCHKSPIIQNTNKVNQK